jgi:diguanylate cyclase (GGDEF)-like protein
MNFIGSCELYVSACGTIEHTNAAAQHVLGFPGDALRGQLVLNRLDDSSRKRWRDFWLQWTPGAQVDGVSAPTDLNIVRGDGSWVPTCAEVRVSCEGEPGRAVLTLKPLVAKPLAGSGQAPDSLHDALTGLPNRRGARDVIEAASAIGSQAGETISVACIDLDNFRSVNEGYGHDVAESVLRSVGALLLECAQGFGRVCRTAGDEFLIIRRSAQSAEEMRKFVPSFMSRLHRPIEVGSETLIVTASVGLASQACEGTHFDTLMQRASQAMSRAKRLGRNTWYIAPDEAVPCLQHQLIKTRLYRAIEQGHLALHYQPIVDLRTGRLRSFEALMRWTDEQLGQVSPSTFIPIAEESGLMAALGAWTIEQACQQSVRWREAHGVSGTIAVNVSAVQLQRGEFECDLRRILAEHAVQPGMLELEVTESALVHDGAHLATLSARLREMGIGIAIDDFGTGYSNLLYLKHFHPSKIKIDRSFVQTIMSTVEDRAIVRAVIDMAHAIGAKVVAEGVESEEVGRLLCELGCDEAQGYYFARPGPASDMARWLMPEGMSLRGCCAA